MKKLTAEILKQQIAYETKSRMDRRALFEVWDENSAQLIAQYEKELDKLTKTQEVA